MINKHKLNQIPLPKTPYYAKNRGKPVVFKILAMCQKTAQKPKTDARIEISVAENLGIPRILLWVAVF